MSIIKQPSNIKNGILAQIRYVVDRLTYSDIKTILSPCCKPTFSFEGDMRCSFTSEDGGVYGTKFIGVTIIAPSLGGKDVIAILSSTTFGGGSYQNITLDFKGIWTGDLQTSWENSNANFTAYLSLLPKTGSKVLRVSEPIEITGMPNCD